MGDEGSIRLDAESLDLSGNLEAFSGPQHRSVCIPPILPAPTLFQLETRSPGGSQGCLSSGLEGAESLCEPPMESHRTSPQEGGGASSQSSASCSSVAIPAMVSQAPQPPDRSATENPRPTRGSDVSGMGGATSRDNPASSHVAYLRQHYADKRISGEATDLLLSSWRKTSHMIHSVKSEFAGVLNGVLIPFQDL